MEPFGDVGDGATPVGVVASLAADDVTDDAQAMGDGSTGVVETGFYRENGWVLHKVILYLVIILVYGILPARTLYHVKTKSFVESFAVFA